MCGISALINTRDESVQENLIHQMNDKVLHRGPDGEGFFYGNNFALAHRRLSIIDLSEAGKQPMHKNGDSIIFNGMIYNYIELRQELRQLGHSFKSDTDTEVLLSACQQWGLEAFNKLNGMWAIAWFQSKNNKIIFCRGHFGIKPLYYTKCGDLFAAGSEIKQFIGLPSFKPELNKSVAVNFLVDGSLNQSSATFFKGVFELRAGHYLSYDLNTHQYEITRWYDFEHNSREKQVSYIEATAEVRRLFIDSMRIRMRSDVRVGSCLSGGVDSSAMVSVLKSQSLNKQGFSTITSCYEDKRYDEQLYSDMVTAETGFPALKTFPNLDNLIDQNEIDKIIYHQDQPFSTASHYSEHQVFKTASENGFKVMMDGQGSDEYLCGYAEFFLLQMRSLVRGANLKELFVNLLKRSRHDHINFFTLIGDYARMIYIYPLIPRIKRLIGKPENPWLHKKWSSLLKTRHYTSDINTIHELTIDQILSSSLPYQLHSEDRNSMMFSIEARLPFLDHRLVEYITSLPASLKIKNGYSKYIFREAITEMPELIKKRVHKLGFAAPDEPWFRENHVKLRLELEDAIIHTDLFTPELLNRFDKFTKGELGYEEIYFRAITLNRFMKVFKMRPVNLPSSSVSIKALSSALLFCLDIHLMDLI